MIKIRPYQKSDWSAVLKMLELTTKYHMQIQQPIQMHRYSSKLIRNFLFSISAKHRNNSAILLVAQLNSKVIGFVYGNFKKFNKLEESCLYKTGMIDEIFVDEKYRRQGIGSMLIKKIEKYFAKHKCKLICLTKVHSNNLFAKRLYEKLGYIPKHTEFAKSIDFGELSKLKK